jgi:hypothetical protein
MLRTRAISRIGRAALSLIAVWLISQPAHAAVLATFYSHDLKMQGGDMVFPHAFVRFTGVREAGGDPVDSNVGFTAKSVTPALLFGNVPGEVIGGGDETYIRASKAHLAITLTDAQYDALLAEVDVWRHPPGSIYALKGHNCVSFVADMAQALGLVVHMTPELMMKPASFLTQVAKDNPQYAIAPSPAFTPR